MFERVQVPIAGLVENMSHFQCPNCQHASAIFSEGGGEALAQALEIPLLGSVPLVPELGRAADDGQPLSSGALAEQFESMASALTVWLAKRPRGYSQHFANVRCEAD